MTRLLPYVTVAACWLTACSSNGGEPIVVTDIRIEAPRPGAAMSAGYMTLRNPGQTPITVSAISSPQYGTVDMHETVVEDGVARMRELPRLLVPAGGEARLEPGGRHLMLRQPATDAGPVTLEFWSGDTLLLTAETTLQGAR